MNGQKWVRSSLRHLSEKLGTSGHLACPKTVARLLKQTHYSLKANVKRLAGSGCGLNFRRIRAPIKGLADLEITPGIAFGFLG
jgi:hypothetical protein